MSVQRRIVLLVDGVHTAELVTVLDRALPLQAAELILVYVRGQGARRGLDLVRHRPGGVGMPAHRERVIDEAEEERGANALGEAERRARDVAHSVRTVAIDGEAGRSVVELAEREGADLIAVRADRARLGPAARFITDHAACSVVVLRLDR